jgi:thymidylate synthase ThyX
MTCEVKIIADSINRLNVRITTFQLRYWRAIHSEFMTHRVFSRNAMSSRAVPVEKMLKQVRNEPAGPIRFMKNKPGMQATEYCTSQEEAEARATWDGAAASAAYHAEQLMAIGIHKQFANRLLEPFQYISVVVTATDWDNFWALRCHPDAMPEIQELAIEMKKQYDAHAPQLLSPGEWHTPYADSRLSYKDRIIQSVARCARVSYNNHDGSETTMEGDTKLHNQLTQAVPPHMSPAEHQAECTAQWTRSGNFGCGWSQYRKQLEVPNG